MPAQGHEIRRAYITDMPDIERLREGSFGNSRTQSNWKEQRFLRRRDHDKKTLHAIAMLSGQAIGTGLAAPHPQEPADIGIGKFIVAGICVHDDFKGNRVGSDIMEFLEAESIELGANSFELTARNTAIGFYESLGYELAEPRNDRTRQTQMMKIVEDMNV